MQTKIGPGRYRVEHEGETYEVQRMMGVGWSSGRRHYATQHAAVIGGGPFLRVTCGDRVIDVPEPAEMRYREPTEDEMRAIVMQAR